MKEIIKEVRVGIRDKETNDIVKIYPYMVKGDFEEITNEVLDWYYMQGCENGEKIEHYFVDVLD
ncbi:MAG: hypothetical protein ACOZCL_12595 [Bacillota bacterium]